MWKIHMGRVFGGSWTWVEDRRQERAHQRNGMMLVVRVLQLGEWPAEQEEQRWTQSAKSLLMSPARLQGPGHTSKEEKKISLQL